MRNTLTWFIKWRWVLLGLILFILINMQVAELMVIMPGYYHLLEFLAYLCILAVVGVFMELLLRSSNRQNRTLAILDAKHRLSLALAGAGDWDGLVRELVRFPGSLAAVEASGLFVRDAISGQFERAAYWHRLGAELPCYADELACPSWVAQLYSAGQMFARCPAEEGLEQPEYCLPIRQADNLLAFIRFRLCVANELPADALEVFKNINDEMYLAIKAGQARKNISELTSSQAALAERQMVSHILHDNLGQNLGYLRLKIDQLLTEREQLSAEQMTLDLEHMRTAADESYEIVRGTLEKIHPRTVPHLMNLLQENARKVAERAHFAVDFEVRGRPLPFKEDVQSAIFYVCHEVLSNVEKHSHADHVKILADWRMDEFILTISDNGVGFNLQSVDPNRHFGLEIMNERINNINGHITLESSHESGTVVTISLPTPPGVHL